MGFIAKVTEAEAALTPANILEPAAAKALLDSTPEALLLDVQDPGSDMLSGSHNASLGTLFFKASTDLADFKDPKIADRPKDGLIIVNCGLGGQAKVCEATPTLDQIRHTCSVPSGPAFSSAPRFSSTTASPTSRPSTAAASPTRRPSLSGVVRIGHTLPLERFPSHKTVPYLMY